MLFMIVELGSQITCPSHTGACRLGWRPVWSVQRVCKMCVGRTLLCERALFGYSAIEKSLRSKVHRNSHSFPAFGSVMPVQEVVQSRMSRTDCGE